MKYLNILLIILPFIFSCSSDTPENDKEKIPPIIDTSIRVGTFNVDVGQTATAEEIALSLKSFYLASNPQLSSSASFLRLNVLSSLN